MPVTEDIHENGKRKFVPIHDVSIVQLENLCALYAFTGCDSISFFAGHFKDNLSEDVQETPRAIQ